jgi:hypothetical protein
MARYFYGRKDGRIVSILDVPFEEYGLRCGCTCVQCGEPLEACSIRPDNLREAHFKHRKSTREATDEPRFACSPDWANESGLHLLAKEIIEEEQCIAAPAIGAISANRIARISEDMGGVPLLPAGWSIVSIKDIQSNQRDSKIHAAEVFSEYRIDGNDESQAIIADLFLNANDFGPLCIELFVTHRLPAAKKRAAWSQGIPMLEIDLSDFYKDGGGVSKEKLKEFLLESTNHREWVYHKDYRTAADFFASTISTILAQKKAKRDKCHDIIAGYLSDPASYSEQLKAFENNTAALGYIKGHPALFRYAQPSDDPMSINEIPWFTNIPIWGETVFLCDRRIWQGYIFSRYVLGKDKLAIPIRTPEFTLFELLTAPDHNFSVPVNWNITYRLSHSEYEDIPDTYFPRDVILKYIRYLEYLGFVQIDDYGSWAKVQHHDIVPQNQRHAEYLHSAIDKIKESGDFYSPHINSLIDKELSICGQKEREELQRQKMAELAARKEREQQQEEKVRNEREQAANARRVAIETFDYEHSPLPMYDDNGYRMAKCIKCGKVMRALNIQYEPHSTNIGICRACASGRRNPPAPTFDPDRLRKHLIEVQEQSEEPPQQFSLFNLETK